MQSEEVPPVENDKQVESEEADNDTERQPGLADVMANLEKGEKEKEKEVDTAALPEGAAELPENEENDEQTDEAKSKVAMVTPVQLMENENEEAINNHHQLLESEGETEVAQPKVIKKSPRSPKEENEHENDTEK